MIAIKENISLAPYTVYKIGGSARFFIEASAKDHIIEAAAFARARNIPFLVLGAGSNVLISDAGYNGVVIHLAGGKIESRGASVRIDSGVMMARAAHEAAQKELAGFEWAVGIPGTVGGSVRGNAGCFGGEMKDVVRSVEVFDTVRSTMRRVSRAQSAFAYRDSFFKRHPELIILSATLVLRHGSREEIQNKIVALSKERAEKQDIGAKSCGCIFKNAAWDSPGSNAKNRLHRIPELRRFEEAGVIPASFLIDTIGWKGKAIGRARVSKKHANFFVNEGGASADEALMLMSAVKNDVARRCGVVLEEEIQLIGF